MTGWAIRYRRGTPQAALFPGNGPTHHTRDEAEALLRIAPNQTDLEIVETDDV